MRKNRFLWSTTRKEYHHDRGDYGFWFDEDYPSRRSVFCYRHCRKWGRKLRDRSGDYRCWKRYRDAQYKGVAINDSGERESPRCEVS